MARLEEKFRIAEERRRMVAFEQRTNTLVSIARLLDQGFDDREFRDLVLELRYEIDPPLDYENLMGQTKWEKMNALVGKFDRRGRLHELVEVGRVKRAHLPWPLVDPPVLDIKEIDDD